MHQRRALLGMNQTMLGSAVGLTYQQIQKYERGANRISSSRLWQFAQALDVPVSFFFEELPARASAGRKAPTEPGNPFHKEKDPLVKRETLELVRGYYKIRDGRVRRRIFEMVKAVGTASQGDGLAMPKTARNGRPAARRARAH
jgi:transcriptional regulator with XRE-family HTH domain